MAMTLVTVKTGFCPLVSMFQLNVPQFYPLYSELDVNNAEITLCNGDDPVK